MSVSLPLEQRLSLQAVCDNSLCVGLSHTICNIVSATSNLVCVFFQLQNMDHCISGC